MTGEQARPFFEWTLHVPCGKHKPTEEPQAGSNKQQRFPQTHLPGSRIRLRIPKMAFIDVPINLPSLPPRVMGI